MRAFWNHVYFTTWHASSSTSSKRFTMVSSVHLMRRLVTAWCPDFRINMAAVYGQTIHTSLENHWEVPCDFLAASSWLMFQPFQDGFGTVTHVLISPFSCDGIKQWLTRHVDSTHSNNQEDLKRIQQPQFIALSVGFLFPIFWWVAFVIWNIIGIIICSISNLLKLSKARNRTNMKHL